MASVEKKRSKSVTTVSYDIASGMLVLTVLGSGGGEIKMNVADFVNVEAYLGLTEVGQHALMHGFEQKLRDRAAIERDDNGKSATPAEKFAAVKALYDHLIGGGEWTMKGGGFKPLDRAALFNAVANVRGRNPEDVAKVYQAKEDAVLRTLLSNAEIAAEYAKLTSRGTNSKAEELLAELEMPEGEETEEANPATESQ